MFKILASRMNGWALSLALHGGLALVAGLSVFGVHAASGGGSGSGGPVGNGGTGESFTATLRSGDDEVVSGSPVGDPPQYGRLTSEQTELEPIAEELPVPSTPVDIFSVGASEPFHPAPSPVFETSLRPGAIEGRYAPLPAAGGDESGEGDAGKGSSGASGGDGGTGTGDPNGVGGGDGDGAATEVYTPAPAYPSDARRRNIEGTVIVELAIDADGSCSVKRLLESSGFASLDDAVQATVRHWKYRPADADGRAATTTKRIRFVFKLGSR